jgi:demethylmenaquinone methyltransferase/2-methoxy-6-polyprenyl-1,4-benzoquinol methylase
MSPAPLPPHAPLTAYYRDEADRHRFLRRIFDETAPDYDRIESVLALGSGPWYRRKALSAPG